MNKAQQTVKADIVNLIRLGIQAAGYVDLTDEQIDEVLRQIALDKLGGE